MIKLIAAVAKNGVIGKDGKIPWRLPEDMKRFKVLTMGHVLVMGRKTYESIGRPLPGRLMIVLTRAGRSYPFPLEVLTTEGIEQAVSVGETLLRATKENGGDIFICGGTEVYRAALEADIVDELLMTYVRENFEGDAFMPEIDYSKWLVDTGRSRGNSSPEIPFTWDYVTHVRRV